jgi:hypothetical protein
MRHLLLKSSTSERSVDGAVPAAGAAGFPPQQTTACLHFHYASGFEPPKYSHICQTPWSVLQDGSVKTIYVRARRLGVEASELGPARAQLCCPPTEQNPEPQNLVRHGAHLSRGKTRRSSAQHKSQGHNNTVHRASRIPATFPQA